MRRDGRPPAAPADPPETEHSETARRQLPAHIAAQLRSAGRATDTGGQPWEGRNLGEGTSHTHQFPDDDGQRPPQLAEALDRFARAELPEESVVDVLAGQRLFVPVLAQLSQAHVTEEGLVSDKESEMALVSIQAPDGRKALPAFSSVDRLTDWHAQARPVAAEARRIALSAVEDENQLLVLDPGAELTFVLRRPALWSLAKGQRWLPSYADPRVHEHMESCAQQISSIRGVELSPGRGVASLSATGELLPGGGAGPELAVTLLLAPGLGDRQVQEVVEAFHAAVAADEHLAQAVDSMELALRSA